MGHISDVSGLGDSLMAERRSRVAQILHFCLDMVQRRVLIPFLHVIYL